MRYLAVLMSIVLHVLSVFILADFVLQNYEPEDTFDVELVTLSDTKICKEDAASVTASTHSKKILNPELSKKMKKSRNKPAVRSSEIKQTGVHVDSAGRPEKVRVAQDQKVTENVVKPATAHRNYPHIETGTSSDPDAIVLRQGKGVTVGNSTMVLKRGSEARSLSSLAAYSFAENDFRGHYETFTGRQIVIIDGRSEYGRLILHDRKTGLTRKLKKSEFGEFIYTYGPSFNEDEPVKGSVVFLPGDEHWIHRFMWMPEGAPAEYPIKGRVDAIPDSKENDDTDLFLPAAKGRYPAIVLAGYGVDISEGEFAEVARHLSGKGFVVLCIDSLSSGELNRAYEKLKEYPKVDLQRVGVWARCYGAKKMPRMDLPAGLFTFVILTIDHPEEGLFPERIASALADGVPTFIGFRGVSDDWKKALPVILTGFQSAPHQIVMIDDTSSNEEGLGTDQGWIDCISGDFVSSISAWLDSN